LDVIEVDLSCCNGHGKCYRVAGDLLQPMDDHGHAEFYAPPIDANDPADAERRERGQAAIDRCPEMALSWKSV